MGKKLQRVSIDYTMDCLLHFDLGSTGALGQNNDPYKVHLQSCISFLLSDAALQRRLWESQSHWCPSQPGSEVFMGPELKPSRCCAHKEAAVSKLFSPVFPDETLHVTHSQYVELFPQDVGCHLHDSSN